MPKALGLQARVSRFWSRVDETDESGCWRWKGSVKNGYGRFFYNYVERYAHREAYLQMKGPVPEGMHVMHLCNNKLCCNPSHLQAGTPSENTQAAARDGLSPTGMRHAMAKYDAAFIARVASDPRPQLEIARDLGISQSHVSRIKNNQTRKWDNAEGS